MVTWSARLRSEVLAAHAAFAYEISVQPHLLARDQFSFGVTATERSLFSKIGNGHFQTALSPS